LQSLSDFITNPSVTGYMIEQAVLASIAYFGLDVPRLRGQMDVSVFHDQIPNLKPQTNRTVLHIPQIFNYKAIDGIIVKQEKPVSERKKTGITLPIAFLSHNLSLTGASASKRGGIIRQNRGQMFQDIELLPVKKGQSVTSETYHQQAAARPHPSLVDWPRLVQRSAVSRKCDF